jgi:protein-tyrosine phosphatase
MTSIEIGGVVNARSFGEEPMWLVRSGALDGMTPAGRDRLAELGVTLVVDLREADERAAQGRYGGRVGDGPEVRQVSLYATPGGPPETGAIEEAYAWLLRECGASIAAAVSAIADADGAVLVHCTAGQERTDLVVALALLLGGMPRDDVLADAESDVKQHRESPYEAMRHALDLVDELGGPHAYLLRHGMIPEQFTRLRDRATTTGDVDFVEYIA